MRTLIVLATLLLFTGVVRGEDGIHALLARLKSTAEDPVALERTLKRGEGRIILCSHCHGHDGNSLRDHVPNLAGQNAEYLLRQFEYFGSGKRKNFVMTRLAATLDPEDRIAIALWYGSQKVRPRAPSDPSLIEQGRRHFQAICFSCHGRDGLGHAALPRLANQPEQYVINTLTAYRNGERQRPESPMNGVATRLKDEEIRALAAYITSMNPELAADGGASRIANR
ncbi:MAG TPA: c-type cytochrome [Thiotrichales bacterium]|nr:c-type cytochrome [Thiotrichales bacterium]